MNTRSLLLYVPGYPFTSVSLMPQRALATGAACLLEEGHWTRVLDYGTVRSMSSIRGGPSDLSHSARARACEARDRRIDEIIEAVSATPSLDFVVFLVHERPDLIETRKVAERLRALHPQIRQIIAGRYVNAFAPILLSQCGLFEGAVVGDIAVGLAAFAGCADKPERWPRLPGLLTRDRGNEYKRIHPTSTAHDRLPAPRYDEAVYPAAHAGDKFKVFMIEHGKGLQPLVPTEGHARPDIPWSPPRVAPRSARSVCLEMAHLVSDFRAGAFHIDGAGTPADATEDLARELMSRAMPVRYSRSGSITHSNPALTGALAASGCLALGCRVDSGSQRLLDDFYGHDFTVSRIEQVYRACRKSGIFSAAHFTYPCPWDDEHTYAETLRLLARTRPHAASVAGCAMLPGSLCRQRAADFGFLFNNKRYLRWVCGERGRKDAAYRMRGWSQSSVSAAQRDLLTQINAFDIAPQAYAHEGLLARLAGFTGNERPFIRELRGALLTADAERLTALIEEVNAGAILPRHRVLFPAFDPVLAVVGN